MSHTDIHKQTRMHTCTHACTLACTHACRLAQTQISGKSTWSDHFLLGHTVVHKCLPKRVPRLTTSSLPQEDPQHLKQLAEKLFNASVATSTARKYDIATRHVAKLEAELGRELPFPPLA